MIEAIENLWLDRESFTLHGTIFDDLAFITGMARDAAREVADRSRHPLGYVSRVAVDSPSDRMLRSGTYFNACTVSIGGPFGARLVLRPIVPDDECGYLAGLEAHNCYAGSLRWMLGDADGIIRVVSFLPDRLRGAPRRETWP